MENCSKYSGSTVHTSMKLEPPLHRTASKVYSKSFFILKLQLNIISLSLDKAFIVVARWYKCSPNSEELWV